ncbi:MAG: NADH-quinone oxidoreductase subunit NuoG [Rickettsiaceae bacterium]|nr:NADH-quinone oxidoreductase subunit NuoG [Rickettsiaceae bacterium]
MAKLTIDGKNIEVEDGIALIQACELAGVEIPRFCYHDRLKIAGNCRMCLVEVEKAPKPVASCAMPVSDGMIVKTNSPKVIAAREGALEFLLINHPLDCPICDKGGECDLQDQSYKYGKGSSRFEENKRGVRDKYFGPLIQTHMTRCIHCTRCIRFMEDVAGTAELCATGRGEHMEITTYLETAIKSELSGNIIDLCPVGALNSKPYAYTARRWELKSTNSIDVFDAMGSNIRIDTRGFEVMRILPDLNEEINEEWISDRIRFSYDGLKIQRIDRAYVRESGKLYEKDLDKTISTLAQIIKSKKTSNIGAIAGIMTDLETMYSVKTLLAKLGSENIDHNQFGYYLDSTRPTNYLFNSGFYGLEDSDVLILIGCNISKNAPVLGARICKLQKAGQLGIYRIGEEVTEAFKPIEYGPDVKILEDILNEKNNKLSKILQKAKKPLVIVGDAVYSRSDAGSIMNNIQLICEKYKIINESKNDFNLLLNHAATTGALALGFTPSKTSLTAESMAQKIETGELDILFLLGADEIQVPSNHKGIIVYIGHHGDINANKADIILPACAFTEKNVSFMNNEGKIQKTNIAAKAPANAIPEYQIIQKISEELDIELGFKTFEELRTEIQTKLNGLDRKSPPMFTPKSKVKDQKLKSPLINFYLSNSISRASKTMAACAKEMLSEQILPEQPIETEVA